MKVGDLVVKNQVNFGRIYIFAIFSSVFCWSHICYFPLGFH